MFFFFGNNLLYFCLGGISLGLNKVNKPKFFSFQRSLPKLSVPNLNDTINRYLISIRPLLNDESYEKVFNEAFEFKNGIGKKLQRDLIRRSWLKDNYVSEWWEKHHYLNSRESLMYGTNIYMSDNIHAPTTIQSARAANLVKIMIEYRENMFMHDPIRLRNDLVPICVNQYKRLFNTTRIPGIEKDRVDHFKNSHHIAVICKGYFYKVTVIHENVPLNASELEYQIKQILNHANESDSVEKYIASLTSLNRTRWANLREEFFSSDINKLSLDIIESSAFVLALDEEDYIFDLSSTPEEYGKYGKILLVGNGYNR